MHYHAYEFAHALLAPWRLGIAAFRATLDHPLNPLASMPPLRSLSAACEVFEKITRRYGKPPFAIPDTSVNGSRHPVREDVLLTRPFCTLRRFSRQAAMPAGEAPLPQVLLVAPMSGHYATLLRGTIASLVSQHDVVVTDWTDARDVPLLAGRFDLSHFIDHLIDFLRALEPGAHVVAVSQSSVPALAATALLAQHDDPVTPVSLSLLGGPIDTRINPTPVNRLVESRPLSWFENNVISLVPPPHAGAMRRVYPGFMQLTGFMTMDLEQHMSAHAGLFRNLVRGDHDSVRQHREFYEDYLAVMDLTAEFFLDTVEHVFQEQALPRGSLCHHGERIDLSAIRSTALFTIEAEEDVVCGQGQTHATLDLCAGLPARFKRRYDLAGAGHFGLFNGARWRGEVAPRLAAHIRDAELGIFGDGEPGRVVHLPLAR